MIHNLFLVGTIKKIQVSTPKDPKRPASAVVLVQYGPSRETTGGQVEFVNAVMVRIPSYKYPKVADSLKVDVQVIIHGHLQGVYKQMMDEGYFTTELVADRIEVNDVPVSTEAPAPAADTSAAA